MMSGDCKLVESCHSGKLEAHGPMQCLSSVVPDLVVELLGMSECF